MTQSKDLAVLICYCIVYPFRMEETSIQVLDYWLCPDHTLLSGEMNSTLKVPMKRIFLLYYVKELLKL